MYSAIFWKEYRQQFSLWTAMFLMLIGIQMLFGLPYACSARFSETFNPGSFFAIALVFSALYTATSAALLYSKEHEEKTYSLIRNLPVPRKTLLAGKLGWLLAGSTAYFVLSLLVTLPWVAICEGFGIVVDRYDSPFYESFADLPWQVLWVPVGCLLFPMCWGLFFSTRSQHQMQAVMGTILFSLFSFWVTLYNIQSLILENPDQISFYDWCWFLVMGLFFGGITLLAGGFGVYSGYRWFDIWIDKGSRFAGTGPAISQTAQSRAAEYERLRTIPFRKRGEFAALCLHVFRQSSSFFLSAIWINTVCIVLLAICVYVGDRSSFSPSLRMILDIVQGAGVCSLFVVAAAFCGSVFSADQQTRAAFLADRGISPRKIWWSRFLVFAAVWAGCASFDSCLIYYAAHAHVTVYGPSGIILILDTLIWFGCLMIPILVGTFVSMFFRSRIVSILVTLAFIWFFLVWLNSVGFYLSPSSYLTRCYHWLWYAAPILLGWLAASRLRCDDWLRGRSLWRSRRPVVSCIVLPLVVICCVIPFYRVYSVKRVDYGYRAAPEALQPGFDSKPNSAEIKTFLWEQRGFNNDQFGFKELRSHIREIENSYTDPNEADLASYYWDLEVDVRRALEWRLPLFDPMKKQRDAREAQEGTYQTKLPSRWTVDLDQIDPRLLDQGIAILESFDTDRAPFSERFKRIYEVDYRRIKYGQIPYPLNMHARKESESLKFWRTVLFWERTRTLRCLESAFQVNCHFADRMEKAVFQGQGDLKDILNRAEGEWGKYRDSWNDIWFNDSITVGIPLGYTRLYSNELLRRFTILQFALLKYRKETGVFPETLEELKTIGYLKEIPKVPYYDQPFYYDPNPDGSEPAYTQGTTHGKGKPYLWGPGVVKRNEVQPKPFREETDAEGNTRRVWLGDSWKNRQETGYYFDLDIWSKEEQGEPPPVL